MGTRERTHNTLAHTSAIEGDAASHVGERRAGGLCELFFFVVDYQVECASKSTLLDRTARPVSPAGARVTRLLHEMEMAMATCSRAPLHAFVAHIGEHAVTICLSMITFRVFMVTHPSHGAAYDAYEDP